MASTSGTGYSELGLGLSCVDTLRGQWDEPDSGAYLTVHQSHSGTSGKGSREIPSASQSISFILLFFLTSPDGADDHPGAEATPEEFHLLSH